VASASIKGVFDNQHLGFKHCTFTVVYIKHIVAHHSSVDAREQ
jgi:hypothetical protein